MFFNKKEVSLKKLPAKDTAEFSRNTETTPKSPFFVLHYDGFDLGWFSFRLSNAFYYDMIKYLILSSIPIVTANNNCMKYRNFEWEGQVSEHSLGFTSENGYTDYKFSYYFSEKYKLYPIINNISQCGVHSLEANEKAYRAMSFINLATFHEGGTPRPHICQMALDRGIHQPILQATEHCMKEILRQTHLTCIEQYTNIPLDLLKLCEKEEAERSRILNEYFQNTIGISYDAFTWGIVCVIGLIALIKYLQYGFPTHNIASPSVSLIEKFEKEYQNKKQYGLTFEKRLENIEYNFSDLPQEFTDAISLTVINDPVKLNKRYKHDVQPLLQWWKMSPKKTSPLSPDEKIISIEPDNLLKTQIEEEVARLETEYNDSLRTTLI